MEVRERGVVWPLDPRPLTLDFQFMTRNWRLLLPINQTQLRTNDIRIPVADSREGARARLSVQMDPGEGGMGAVIDDVLDLLHVDRGAGQDTKNVGQDPGPVS